MQITFNTSKNILRNIEISIFNLHAISFEVFLACKIMQIFQNNQKKKCFEVLRPEMQRSTMQREERSTI